MATLKCLQFSDTALDDVDDVFFHFADMIYLLSCLLKHRADVRQSAVGMQLLALTEISTANIPAVPASLFDADHGRLNWIIPAAAALNCFFGYHINIIGGC